jgi:rhodanese-related sulfurtransferase
MPKRPISTDIEPLLSHDLTGKELFHGYEGFFHLHASSHAPTFSPPSPDVASCQLPPRRYCATEPPNLIPPAVVLPTEVRQVTTPEAQQMIAAGVKLLDARHWDEMKDSPYLPGAIPCGFLEKGDEELIKLDRTASYLLYCPLGERSALMAIKMKELGFTQLAHLRGGLRQAREEGLR